jgi:enterobactin synthetase component F
MELMSPDTAPDLVLERPPSRAQQPRDDGAKHSNPLVPGRTHFPLTIAQTPIALDSLALRNSPVANTGDIAHISGPVDTRLFAAACRRVVAETAAIRVSLDYRDGALLQKFPELDDYVLEQHDCSVNESPEQAAQAWIEEHFWITRPWNSFPLFQFALLKIRDDQFVFVQKFHHVLADAIGRFQCFQRITAVYEALAHCAQPAPSQTRPLTARIAEDAAYLDSNAYQADLAYWTNRLDNLPEPLVDADRRKTERSRSGRSRRLSYVIAPEDFARLKQCAAAHGASVPRLVLALAYVGIARLYGVNDMVIGTPSHNRATQAAKRSIDLAMTVMPFRMTFESGVTIIQMLKDIAVMQVADRRRSRFPFASLVRPGGQPGAGQGSFDVIFNYIPAMEPVCLGGVPVSYTNYSAGFYLPLAIDMREASDGLGAKLTLDFDPGLVDAEDGARLARCLHFLLTNPVAFSQHTIGNIPIISAAERHHLLAELNDNDMPVPADATLASLCARQAERTPDAIAVTCGTGSITYARLHERADALARHFTAAGVQPEVIVGVAMPRSIELIVALLAIHKAGGAYLPLDPAWPADRVAYMICDAQAPLLVTTKALANQLSETTAKRILLDDPAWDSEPATSEPVAARPENLAYVIYTSGSTGHPKGVAIEHRNAVNLVLFHAAHTEPDELRGILGATSLNFDASIDEIFVSLACGGHLILVESLLALPAAPARSEVRLLDTVPSVFEALLQIDGFDPRIRRIRFGGEPLSRSLVDRVLAIAPDVRIENAYGPTETTVDATISTVRFHDSTEPPIGKGLWNTKLYVLDRNMELLPKGAKGELYIGGAGVARGYLGKPEMTAERFVNNPFGEGRLYRTGDIVRWREDGELAFFRRADTQVKINGLRIELGEIERQLEAMPEIAHAVAVVHPDDHGIKRIFAFAVARDSRPAMSAVTMHLHGKLPKYMTPAALTWVENFPLTPSGKLDRKALSLPAWRGPERSYRAPSNRDETSLARIWSQVLGIPKIGTDDDFFQLGGTSLQAVMIFAKISRAHGFDLPASTMIRAPTIALQAVLLKEAWRANDRTLLVTFREKGDGAPLFFVHGGGGGVMYVRDLMQDLKCGNPLYGLHAPPVDGTGRLPRSVEKFAATYVGEIRKMQPIGPYHIIGFSVGGTIAYEIARQLQDSGETVALLGLIETDTGRYRNLARKTGAAVIRRATIFQAVKRIYGTARKTVKRIKDKAPNELRHALGLAVPHDEREYFYMRWFRDIETTYTPRLYRGPVAHFACQTRLESYRTMWSTLAVGGLIMRSLPLADHNDVVLLPNSRFLAMQIDASLNALASTH